MALKRSCATALARALRAHHTHVAPSLTDGDRLRAYVDDPVGFARDVLHINPSRDQRRIMAAVLAQRRVAVRSGHKVGKSTTFAILALWFYCTRASSRVQILAATDRQVNGIIWREIQLLVRRAAIPIPGASDMGKRAATGLVNPADLSEIKGYTAKEAEGVAGISGAAIMYLLDEASGIPETIFTAIQGNLAGGNAWQLMISNPTKSEFTFFDAFHSKSTDAIGRRGWTGIHIDSRQSPNVTGEWRELDEWRESEPGTRDWAWRPRLGPIPGMADPEWVEMMRDEWGEESAQWHIRVVGDFVAAEDKKIFPYALLHEAQENWEEATAEGRLWIGIDPAGPGAEGDESAFAVRRGQKVLQVLAFNGLTEEQHLQKVLELIAAHPLPKGQREPGPPVVVLDVGGKVGTDVRGVLQLHAEGPDPRFVLVAFRPSDLAVRQPKVYYTKRDELAANLRTWMREGGTIPVDTKLEKDLHALEYTYDSKDRNRLIPKEGANGLRAILGRSPDRGDAVQLCCWEPRHLRDGEHESPPPPPPPQDPVRPLHNPYTGMGMWRPGREEDAALPLVA